MYIYLSLITINFSLFLSYITIVLSALKFYLLCTYFIESESRLVLSDSLPPHVLYSPWNSPGQNTGVVSLLLLQGIFPTQGSNLGLPPWGQTLYQLSHQRCPRILEWGARPFSTGSSRPRSRIRVSCIVGAFFTHWAIREAPNILLAIFLWSRIGLEVLSCKGSGDKYLGFVARWFQLLSSAPCSEKIVLDDI